MCIIKVVIIGSMENWEYNKLEIIDVKVIIDFQKNLYVMDKCQKYFFIENYNCGNSLKNVYF